MISAQRSYEHLQPKYLAGLDLAYSLIDTEDTDVTPDQAFAWEPRDLYEWLEIGWNYRWSAMEGKWEVL